MNRSVILDARQRLALLDRYRKDPNPEARFRAHILLLLDDGHTWEDVVALLFCSSRTIDRWVKRFQREGVEAVAGHKPGRPFRFGPGWLALAITWITTKAPRDFGFLRSRWCCELIAVLMLRVHDLQVSRETVRRWLHRGGMVYRRPRPVVKPDEAERRARLAELRQVLADLPDNETAVFQDEVDVNTNPKIGSMWMFRGRQAQVETPGDNEKRYVAGSIHWRSGQVFLTEGKPKQGRNEDLFIAHLDDLRDRLRRYKKIHVICDNAKFHKSQAVMIYLWDHQKRIELHFLPRRSPDYNPIERVWWHLHEEVTRNHQCRSMEELLDFTFDWFNSRNPFQVEGSVYNVAA
jgi:transposase